MKLSFWRVIFLAIIAALILAIWQFSFGLVWDALFWTIVVVGFASNLIFSRKMRRQIRDDLGRKATDLDLASINAWIAVDEKEKALGKAPPPKFQCYQQTSPMITTQALATAPA